MGPNPSSRSSQNGHWGLSDDLDYHSAWDTIKVAAYAAGGKLNKLKEEPGMADCDAPLEDESDPCRAICSNGRPCRNQVHRNAGRDGHCPFTCELHKHSLLAMRG